MHIPLKSSLNYYSLPQWRETENHKKNSEGNSYLGLFETWQGKMQLPYLKTLNVSICSLKTLKVSEWGCFVCLYMSVDHMQVWPCEGWKKVSMFGMWVTDGRELPCTCRCWESRSLGRAVSALVWWVFVDTEFKSHLMRVADSSLHGLIPHSVGYRNLKH